MAKNYKIEEHYSGSRYKKDALGYVDQLIGYATAQEDYKRIEVLKDLRKIIELYWSDK